MPCRRRARRSAPRARTQRPPAGARAASGPAAAAPAAATPRAATTARALTGRPAARTPRRGRARAWQPRAPPRAPARTASAAAASPATPAAPSKQRVRGRGAPGPPGGAAAARAAAERPACARRRRQHRRAQRRHLPGQLGPVDRRQCVPKRAGDRPGHAARVLRHAPAGACAWSSGRQQRTRHVAGMVARWSAAGAKTGFSACGQRPHSPARPCAQKRDVGDRGAQHAAPGSSHERAEPGAAAADAPACGGGGEIGRLYDLVGSLYEVGPEAHQRMLEQLEPTQRCGRGPPKLLTQLMSMQSDGKPSPAPESVGYTNGKQPSV